MTAYAPPSYSYFSGLQFNPNIYEQTKTAIGQRLYGGLVTIIGTISTIFTTPLFEVIQGATITLNMIEASTDFINTSYFKIKAPNIYFSPLGTWSAFTCSSSLTQFYNPTQVTISSPGFTQTGTLAELQATTTTITGDTGNLSSYTTNINGTLTQITSPTTAISGTLISLSAITTNVAGTTTNLTSPTTNISGSLLTTLSAPTTTVTGTLTNLSATTTTVSGTTTNLNATTTNISSDTLNLSSTTAINQTNTAALTTFNGPTLFPTTSEIRVGAVTGTYPLYTNLPTIGITNTTGGGTIVFPAWSTIQYDSVYFFGASCTGVWTVQLPNVTRNGNKLRIMNLGTGNVNVQMFSGAVRMYGAGLARGGAISYTIVPLQGASFTCAEATGITVAGGSSYFVGSF